MGNHEPQTESFTKAASGTDTLNASKDTQTNEKTTRIRTNDGEGSSQGPKDDQYPLGSKLFFIRSPKITDEFGGLDKVSWYGSAFFMTNGGFQSAWGKAYKYAPLKPTFLASVAVFELGSLVCGAAPNPVALIIGRAIAGVGAAGLGTGVYTIIAHAVPPARRASYTGFVGMSYGAAAVLGPLVGGAFTDRVSWRWCFYINLPIGSLSALIILFLFESPASAAPVAAPWREKLLQMDLVGVALVMAALISYTLALQYAGQSMAWGSSTVVGLLVGSAALAVAFGWWECFQGERAMIPPRLAKKRSVGISSAFTFLFSGPYFLTIYYLPIYFQSIDNASPTMSGVYTLPLILPVTICMTLAGFFVSATGHAAPLEVLGSALATIAAGLLYTLDVDSGTGAWAGFQVLGGVAWGLCFQLPIVVGQSGADDLADLSSITAVVLFFMNLGGTTLLSAAQAAFVNTLIADLPAPAAVVAAGATELRGIFAPEQMPGILAAYMAGIKVALAMSHCLDGSGLGCQSV
ncbi:T-complex protein 1 subunit theta [Pestalotiopsis sp. IQ-011]